MNCFNCVALGQPADAVAVCADCGVCQAARDAAPAINATAAS